MVIAAPDYLPTLFVPHGAPTFALQPGNAGAALASLAQRLPRPQALLVISAHWDTPEPTLGIASRPATLHDYSGFPQALYALRYPAPGAVAWAMEARALLEEADFPVALAPQRGMDHGVWIPLLHMYPDASLPVFMLSIQGELGPSHHYRVGQALAPLAKSGVLILGSGNLTHNLRHFMMPPGGGAPFAYVTQFQEWIRAKLHTWDTAALLDYRNQAPGAAEAHPTDEHLLPFFVALGAADSEFSAERVYSGIDHEMLAMDSYALWPAASTLHNLNSKGKHHV